VRKFTAYYVRQRISDLPYEEAMEQCRNIAELGKALSDLGVSVTVPDIEVLGIEAGEYDVQRLVYHYCMKCSGTTSWTPRPTPPSTSTGATRSSARAIRSTSA
jgi:hypothetical protein